MLQVFAILRNHRLTHLLNEIEVYLYGTKALGLAENKSKMLVTIEYIKQIKIFMKLNESSIP